MRESKMRRLAQATSKFWIEEGGSWGENVEDEIEHRNAIVNGFLEETLDL